MAASLLQLATSLSLTFSPTSLSDEVLLEKQVLYTIEEAGSSWDAQRALEAFASNDPVRIQAVQSKRGLNLGFQEKPVWALAGVEASEVPDNSQPFILSLRAVNQDLAEIYILKEGDTTPRLLHPNRQGGVGRTGQISTWFDLSLRAGNVALSLSKGEKALILWRIENYMAPSDLGLFVSPASLVKHRHGGIEFFALLFLGSMVIMGLYNLFLYFYFRNIAYLWFSVFSMLTTWPAATTSGVLYKHIWFGFVDLQSYFPKLSMLDLSFLSPVAFSVLMVFSIHFLNLSKRSLDRYITYVLILFYAVSFILFFSRDFTMLSNQIVQSLSLLLAPYGLYVGIRSYLQGKKEARFFILAFLLFGGSLLPLVLRNVGLIASKSAVYELLGPGGFSVMVCVFALALGDKMRLLEILANEEREKRLKDEKAHKEQVMEMNRSLDRRVKEQTRDIRALLENTAIGILSVEREGNGQLSLSQAYSTHLVSILETEKIAGERFDDLLLSQSHLGPDEKQKIVTALEYTIGEDPLTFEANLSALPSQLEVTFGGRKKILDLDWSPILDEEGRVGKALLSLRDATETRRLQAEAESSRKAVTLLSEGIRMGLDPFRDFVSRTLEAEQSIVGLLDDSIARAAQLSAETTRKIYVILHTIKGEARLHKLTFLTDALHTAEELVTGKHELLVTEILSLKERVVAISQVRESYERAMAPLFAATRDHRPVSTKSENVSFADIFLSFSSVVDELARDLGKTGCQLQSDLSRSISVDQKISSAIRDAMIHLLRNSVDHGLESKELRERSKKPARGLIRLYEDDRGRICLKDDGQGLDLSRLADKAKKMGLSYHDDMSLAQLIFVGGLSTKEVTDDVSGRGVGMDAVRDRLAEVDLSIEIVPERRDGDRLYFHFAIDISSQPAQTSESDNGMLGYRSAG